MFCSFQEKACKQEDRLIARLQEMELDNSLIAVLRRQAIILLDGGSSSGLGLGIHTESIPMHTFARFLFLALLNYYPDLAYEVGLRAMRYICVTFFEIFLNNLQAKIFSSFPSRNIHNSNEPQF